MHSIFHILRHFLGIVTLTVSCSLAVFAADSPSALVAEPQGWIEIMPSSDLAGWTCLPFPKDSVLTRPQWHIDTDRHLLITDGDGGHDMLRYDREVTNGIFHVEFRFVPIAGNKVKYNSGIFVRNSEDGTVWHQCQLTINGGFLFGDTPADSKLHRFKSSLIEPRVKPAGNWNIVEITAHGRTLSVWMNGTVVTYFENCGATAGYLALETEGYAVEFRNLKFKELP